MKPCNDRWRDELMDHVLGSPAGARLAEHLARCTACSATLREWNARMAQIDSGVGQLSNAAPAPQASQRIIAAAHARQPHAWLAGWRWQTGALALLVLVAAFMGVRKVQEQGAE